MCDVGVGAMRVQRKIKRLEISNEYITVHRQTFFICFVAMHPEHRVSADQLHG